MAEQTRLYMLQGQRLAQQGICLQVKHSQAKVEAGAPIRVDIAKLVWCEGATLDSRSRCAVCTDRAVSAQRLGEYGCAHVPCLLRSCQEITASGSLLVRRYGTLPLAIEILTRDVDRLQQRDEIRHPVRLDPIGAALAIAAGGATAPPSLMPFSCCARLLSPACAGRDRLPHGW